jgi:hypothetical protein
MNNVANTLEPNPINSDDSQPALWDLVIKDFNRLYIGSEKTKSAVSILMKERDAFGHKKYSIHLKIHNGRNFLNDSAQEAYDLIVYLRGAIEENKHPEKRDVLEEIYKDTLNTIVKLYEISELEK